MSFSCKLPLSGCVEDFISIQLLKLLGVPTKTATSYEIYEIDLRQQPSWQSRAILNSMLHNAASVAATHVTDAFHLKAFFVHKSCAPGSFHVVGWLWNMRRCNASKLASYCNIYQYKQGTGTVDAYVLQNAMIHQQTWAAVCQQLSTKTNRYCTFRSK